MEEVISNVIASNFVVNKILADISSFGNVPIGMDCEGVNLGINGYATLIQISTISGDVYLFDLITCPDLVRRGGLRKLFESNKIIKVMHDCRNDWFCIYKQYEVLPRNVFDTQCAHKILQIQYDRTPLNRTYRVGLKDLCDQFDVPYNESKKDMKNIYRYDQQYWARRPLTGQMIAYATADVRCLVPSLYTELRWAMKPEYDALFKELCNKNIYANIYPKPMPKGQRRNRQHRVP